MSSSNESKIYAALGASSSKQGVHKALEASLGADPQGVTSSHEPRFFAEVRPDVLGDPDYYSLLHADGAGTKSIVAYIAYQETHDPSWFKSLAIDSCIMNVDDVACVGAFEGMLLSNTIGRNRRLIPDECIEAVISGYREIVALLSTQGVPIVLAGGETADMGDLIRTLVLDSTLFARVKRTHAISTDAILPGDIIIGLSSTGTALYETEPNSSVGSNGFTLARHALIARKYSDKYPEILDPGIDPAIAYRGSHDLFSSPPPLSTSIAKSLLSPTRTYAPILKLLHQELGKDLHGAIHCSGGGQTKILRFGRNVHYVKDSLFECPPVFQLIQQSLSVPWREMYSVFNMGHRMEIILNEKHAPNVIAAAKGFGIEAKPIGHVQAGNGSNSLTIKSPYGTFDY